MRIQYELTLTAWVIIVGVVTIGAILFYNIGSQGIGNRLENQLDSVAQLKKDALTSFINDKELDLKAIAIDKLFIENFNQALANETCHKNSAFACHDTLEQAMNDTLSLHNGFIEFFVLDLNGTVRISTDRNQENKIKGDEKYFIEGKNNTFVQSFYYDISLQKPAVTIATPLWNSNNTLIGVLVGRVDLEKISQIMNVGSGLGNTGETILINKNHLLVSKSRFLSGIEFKKAIYTVEVNNCLLGSNGHAHYDDYRNVPVSASYLWISNYDICLIAKMDESEALAPVLQLRNNVIYEGVGLSIVVIVVFALFASRVTKNIGELRKNMIAFGRGNFAEKISIHSKDEIGDLASAFTKMAKDLKKSREEAQERLLKLRKTYKQLKSVDVMKDEFLNLMAHELKTPLTSIIGMSELMLSAKMGKINKKQGKSLIIVLNEGRMLQKIINRILFVTRIERGKEEYDIKPFNIVDAINRIVEGMQTVAEKRKIQFVKIMPTKVPW